jgi:hypothetical protein
MFEASVPGCAANTMMWKNYQLMQLFCTVSKLRWRAGGACRMPDVQPDMLHTLGGCQQQVQHDTTTVDENTLPVRKSDPSCLPEWRPALTIAPSRAAEASGSVHAAAGPSGPKVHDSSCWRVAPAPSPACSCVSSRLPAPVGGTALAVGPSQVDSPSSTPWPGDGGGGWGPWCAADLKISRVERTACCGGCTRGRGFQGCCTCTWGSVRRLQLQPYRAGRCGCTLSEAVQTHATEIR